MCCHDDPCTGVRMSQVIMQSLVMIQSCILSYSHTVMGSTVMESRVGTVAPHVQVSPSRAIAHPLSQLFMDKCTFGHRDTYLSLTIDSAFKGHIDIIMNVHIVINSDINICLSSTSKVKILIRI